MATEAELLALLRLQQLESAYEAMARIEEQRDRAEARATRAEAERDEYRGRNEAEYYRNEDLSALLSETAAKLAVAEERLQVAVAGLKVVKMHIDELEDAWQRGCIQESDGKGGERSNRNVELRVALARRIAALDAARNGTV